MSQQVTHLQIPNPHHLTLNKLQLPQLGDEEVRIQVLYSGINKNDLLLLQGSHTNDYFGTQAIGTITAIGKKVGFRKIGQIVGVHYNNFNKGAFKTGFTSHIQINQHETIYIPNSIPHEHAPCLLGTGVIAYNALTKVEAGSTIAVIGTGHLAYLTTQIAKKVFGFPVTIFGYEGGQQLSQSFGADKFQTLNSKTLSAHTQKFHSIIVTDVIKIQQSKEIHRLPWRNGKVIYAINMGFYPKIDLMQLVISQTSVVGVSRGTIGQAVVALKAMAMNGIRGIAEVFDSVRFQQAFEKAKEINCGHSIVLRYQGV